MELIVLALVALATLLLKIFVSSRNANSAPGPKWRLPLLGHRWLLQDLCRKHGGLDKAIMELNKQYSSDVVGLHLSGSYTVFVSGEERIKEIFNKPEFQGRPSNYFTYLRSMKTNKGITMTDGPLWIEQRAFVVKQLSRMGFGKALMNTMIEDELQALLKEIGNGGPSIDLSALISLRVLNVLWKIVAGEDLSKNDLLPDLMALMKQRAKAFDIAGGYLTQLPWLRFIIPETSGYNLIISINEKVKTLIRGAIESHKITYNKNVTRDFIDSFLHEMDNFKGQETTFTEDQLLMVCLDLIIGGIQTTSHSLEFSILRILHNQEVQKHAHKELDEVIGDRTLRIEDRAKLPYIQAIIAECLRINNITPVTGPRRTLDDANLGKFLIPKGSTIFMNLTSINFNKNKWAEPEKFNPERFLNADIDDDMLSQFYPFSIGKRRCPGEVLAKNFLFLFIAALLHAYKIEPPEGSPLPSLIPNPGITLTPKSFTVKMTKRH